MSTGSNNTDGDRIANVFNRAGFLARSAFTEGQVAVSWNGTGADNMDVCLPNDADAHNGGRNFMGIWMNAGTATAATDRGPLQKLAVAKCVLKANNACTKGAIAAYLPSDGGSIVPWTAGTQIPIGRFTQTKSSSAAVQFVGVELMPGLGQLSDILLFSITTSSAALSANAETAFNQSGTIPAGLLTAGAVLRISAKANVTAGATGDTLILRLKLGAITLVTTATVDVAANDVGVLHSEVTIRAVGAAGTFTHMGYSALGAAGTATLRAAGSNSTSALDTTVANAVTVTADWSADTADTVVLEDLTCSLLRVAA